MHGKGLLLVHALLGTVCIVLVQLADRAAESANLGGGHPALMYLIYVAIYLLAFVVLLGLDVLLDHIERNRGRRLKVAGVIEGCWVEKSFKGVGDNMECDMGAFISIKYLPDIQFFWVEGEVFEPNGKWFGHFEGHGRPDPGGTKLLYDYHGRHGKDEDDGTGHFAFRQPQLDRATHFSGSFHGATTKTVRTVEGGRTDELPYLTRDERTKQQGQKVVEYIAESMPS